MMRLIDREDKVDGSDDEVDETWPSRVPLSFTGMYE